MLVVSLPISIAVAVLLTYKASNSLSRAAQASSQQLARAVALHMEDFISERQETLSEVAAQVSGNPGGTGVADLLARFDTLSHDYSILEVTNLSGQVLAASRPQGTFDPSSQDWFRTAASGQRVVTTPVDSAGVIHWVLATPVLDAAGRPAGVVVGDLDVAQLPTLLNPELQGRGVHAVAVDKNRKLVYDTNMGAVDGPALLAKGALQTTVDNPAVAGALAGQSGSVRFRDGGPAVVAGYDNVDLLGWAVIVDSPAATVLAPVDSQRRAALLLVAVGAALAVVLALLFARREVRYLVDVARRSTDASTEVNAAAAELSASSEELAATTTEQSAAVTEVSATTEELARAAGSIAETVDGVAAQSAETRENLEQAEADITATSERTLALAERVNQIGAILTLINEIADQTNLLALNAAIEAARAGDSGRGFAVVAEEVRRLAERSKASAADIATIVEGVHSETSATVMAMEKGANQLQQSLHLLEDVAEASAQVRLTTQQQRSATAQVVETMEQLTDASRQGSATAHQIAAAAANLAALANELTATAHEAQSRY